MQDPDKIDVIKKYKDTHAPDYSSSSSNTSSASFHDKSKDSDVIAQSYAEW